ncbi:IS5-like element ISAs4 family transposase [Aeromonas salmonicida]|uniref:IS5-like element ISAs4 family transposase n=1 Tax=Aeromonas salmonicida TaxID=645 RepID=UPI000B58845D|nr:IS5-like element ISAs4 family transposase [Aeromonas salmonicida]ASI22517.1 IS5/IS1182 family transposase [Aeromonas salmonicida]ASI24314.1 IS5/IS1182 family transposase [Aeromonas salmonicida]ASI26832.1 IS5/IS1182 family transposase [Aeromonas salmonicida]ASI28633.1 IS5/IS1182 family transposase [Aeromonas salmonicida]ASI30950.1 IS5/IS1182 family transposase [Aeromonas salmonicida]
MGKALHPITNWPQYNRSLINRGSLTFWVDAEAMDNWFHQDHHGKRGRSQLYTDQSICTFLMLKGIFSLTLRATQGLLDSLFELMNVPLCAPDYSCVSKRARTVKVAYRQPPKGRITDLVIDSTGLKVFGEGEWKVRKHGAEKRRVWRKLHLAVDPVTHDIVAAEVSLENVHDAEVLPTLLSPLRRKLGRVYADGAYDSKASHRLIARKGATACIPPRKNAGLWKKGHPRNEAVQVMRKEGLAHWKKISGYHRRSLAETAMFRFKQLMAGQITLRKYNGQVGEVMAYVSAINKLNTLGLPVRKPRV